MWGLQLLEAKQLRALHMGGMLRVVSGEVIRILGTLPYFETLGVSDDDAAQPIYPALLAYQPDRRIW